MCWTGGISISNEPEKKNRPSLGGGDENLLAVYSYLRATAIHMGSLPHRQLIVRTKKAAPLRAA